jgi:hypothetical protein
MASSRSRRALAVLTLALLACLSPALAQPRPQPIPAAARPGVLDVLRGGFGQLRTTLLTLLGKAGIGIDPNGNPNDAGSRLDPDGTTTENDAGSKLDPDGWS